jgi:hypothetical protein
MMTKVAYKDYIKPGAVLTATKVDVNSDLYKQIIAAVKKEQSEIIQFDKFDYKQLELRMTI